MKVLGIFCSFGISTCLAPHSLYKNRYEKEKHCGSSSILMMRIVVRRCPFWIDGLGMESHCIALAMSS